MNDLARLLPDPPEGVTWTLRGLTVTDPELQFERLEAILHAAGELKRAMSFVIGDALIFAESRYGHRYAQAMDATGLSYQTLQNYRYVCERVRISRRRENLGFGHHADVASFEPKDQTRWLDKAEEKGWSRDDLRAAIRDAKLLVEPRPERLPQEIVGRPLVDAVRNLSTVRETLVKIGSGLELETAEEVGIPRAIRAIDEAGDFVQRAAEAPDLSALARRLIEEWEPSDSGFMVPRALGEQFEAQVLSD